ncbi:hypothetical protein QOZ80_6BG0503450 [Eleusine coracana subsp. coracana]|nr:hypothetical protein QOZ80_6BG0503450 [Eleusine coracana subsp. coracana]
MKISFHYEFIQSKMHSFIRVSRYVLDIFVFIYQFVTSHVQPFIMQLSYFLLISMVGSGLLMFLKPSNPEFSPGYIDMLYLSTSALTTSGLSTVRMEDLSSSQIIVLTLLMFVGGEVFVSFLGLMLRPNHQVKQAEPAGNRVSSVAVELDMIEPASTTPICEEFQLRTPSFSSSDLKKSRSVRYLGFVVFGYLALIHVVGFLLVFWYLTRVPSAREPLDNKGINITLFSVSVTVSSFANAGLIPTNENMAIFSKNTGLLLLLTGQALAGNTLFPLLLRVLIWFLGRVTKLRGMELMIREPEELHFAHLLPKRPTVFLSSTVVGLATTMVVLFCAIDWSSLVLDGLSSSQKIVNALFMAVNARHAGENSIDCSLISPAVLVLFIVMMYLPSSATFAPPNEDDKTRDKKVVPKQGSFLQNLIFSQLGCNIMFMVVACITERRSLSNDPLNFSMMNMIFEVISAYGNVGLSIGYSCSKLQQLHPESICQDRPYSFSGSWSDEGKLLVVLVMLYGRLKAFTKGTGFLGLILLNKPSNTDYSPPRYVDLFFMSTSAVTVTGLATVRMEHLSGSQMVVLTVLMLLGSEMFVSLLGLVLELSLKKQKHGRPDHDDSSKVRSVTVTALCDDDEEAASPPPSPTVDSNDDDDEKKSKRFLALVVSAYMVVNLLLGSLTVFLYVANVPSARAVLTKKRINVALFSASVTVSSFTNGGLIPTNESIAVFSTNEGLLLLLVGQILAGGTLFPVLLPLVLRATRGLARLLFSARGRHDGDDEDEVIRFMSKHATAAGFTHLLPCAGGLLQTAFVAATAVTVAAAAVTLFCCLNWDAAVFAGLAAGEKVANAVFMAVNARQAGENSVDCSLIAPAVLVLFVAMMCTPASASFFSVHNGDGEPSGGGGVDQPGRSKDDGTRKRRLSLNTTLLWSPLALNAAVLMLVCVTERRSLSSDPLNFSTFNMVFEVISAYRNVGLSIGYSCSRLLRPEDASVCHDQPYSFSGWWSDQGKLLLVLLMLCGRLKGFYSQRRRS